MTGSRMRARTAGNGPCLAAGLLLLALAAAAGSARANPLDNYGFGSKWVAMGDAVTALVDDVGAIYYNPAGLVRAESVQVFLEYFYADPHLKVNGYDVGEDAVSGINAGFVMPPMTFGSFKIGSWDIGPIKMGGGGGVHIPDKRVARSLAIAYDQPTFVRYGARNQRMVLMTPFSFEIFPWLQIGAMVSMHIRTSGGPDFVLRENIAENEGIWSEGSISNSQRPSFFPTAGFQATPVKNLHIGFCYRGKNEVVYEIPMDVHIDPLYIFTNDDLEPVLPFPLLPESLIDMDTIIYTFFAPEQFCFGLGYDVGDFLTIGVDLTLERWSAFRNPAPEGTTYFIGGIAAIIPANPNYPLPPPDFSDILVPSIGVEYRPFLFPHWQLVFRAGYRFEPDPAPKATGWNNFLANDTHVFSAGLGLNLVDVQDTLKIMRGPVRFDLHAQYFWLTEGEAWKTNPVEESFGDMVYGGNILNLGCTLTLEF